MYKHHCRQQHQQRYVKWNDYNEQTSKQFGNTVAENMSKQRSLGETFSENMKSQN